MSSPNDVSMEEILLEDDEQDSIEYKILMAYAQRRLSVSKYRKLLKNEANVQNSSSLIRRKVEIDHQRDKDGPSRRIVYQGGMTEQHRKKQSKRKYLPGYCLPFPCRRAEQEKSPAPSLHQGHCTKVCEAQSEIVLQGNPQHQTSETADVNHIADKLAKLVTSRSQESPSDVSFKIMFQSPCQEEDDTGPTDETEGDERDEEKIIQTIVSLLRQSGDQLEEKIKKDRVFYHHFKDMLSYTFFKRITDLFLEDVSAVSTSEPGHQVQCTKVAFTMEVATRLTAVDNHPMNLVLGFGSKYLREHFKPWIQEQGGWEKALTSLDEEEVE
ncbi:PREDICTED: apoptosis facilitator Bcl-2-like protein 14 [Charadrius vociferus]|uniref:apoptosis facilitator Bcl-2-like protein 14 n=1 Tax=Charadrius vociferus TaxID=50402 RepID=UPI0005217D1A|nr:PREDICTED: apoptosis facilitator Bcl-2-like protein 14 [Charadrius vociferus]